MLEIDGSYGEGGGQILRNAVALSTVTNTPIKVNNIRANRPNPGIKAQHYVAIKSIAELCNAQTSGVEIGSSEMSFTPGEIKGGKYKFEIGTAGSITLVFEALILATLNAKEPITISLTGGTDVKWSPTWDYFQYVFLPLLEKSGVKVYTDLLLRGYYPKGGGEAVITINPTNKLKSIKLDKPKSYEEIQGRINISNLPEHIMTRMRNSAIRTLLRNDLMTTIDVDTRASLSPGVGITLWTQDKNKIGTTLLGQKGLTSEEVAKTAVANILKEIQAETSIDIYGFDQILPYMAIAKNSSCIVREITNHASTNMWLVKQFFYLDFHAVQNEDNIEISIK